MTLSPSNVSANDWFGRWPRLGVTTACALGAAVMMRSFGGEVGLWIPTALLGLSAFLIYHDRTGSQLIARSVFWTNLVLGTLIAVSKEMEGGSSATRIVYLGAGVSLTLGTSLLAMGHIGLDERERSVFRPIAFRTSLTLGMILAVADAQALALFAAVKLQASALPEPASMRLPQAAMLLTSAALLLGAIVGLFRLRVWGLFLAALSAAGVCLLSLTDAYGLPGPFAIGLALTSAVQVALSVPVFVTVLGPRPASAAAAPSRVVRLAPAVLIGLLMTVSLAACWLHLQEMEDVTR
jgi:uncharacterized membrane protein (DUF2068 family)